MCGIVGELRFRAEPSDADWPRLIAAIARRGPDDQGLWSDQRHCTLAFRRLAILDLSDAAHQPLISDDGSFAIVLNGEIYNYRELRAELIERGIRFRSTGDAEVALYALAEWGTAALDRFNGMFALAFYSVREAALLLTRDHAGIKPLYVLHDSRGCVFASQFDQILAHPWSRGRCLSDTGRSLYLRLGYVPAPHSMLDGAEMLPAGSWLQVRKDGSSIRGRHFEFPIRRKTDLRGAEANEAVDAAVCAAVRRQMVSDVPVGAFLSGGVDSPLVAAIVASVSGNGIPAFTIGTEDPASDESTDAARYAHELGLTHRLHRMTEAEVLGLLPEFVRACAEPFADYSLLPSMVVSRLAREHVKVVVSGDGGDELFWGYGTRFAAVLRIAEDFRQPHWLRNARWATAKYLGLGSAQFDLRRPSIGEWYRSRHSRIPEGRLHEIFPSLGAWPSTFELFDYHGWQQDRTAYWLRWNEFVGHLSMVLLKVDRASMYHSLEVRVPLLDKEVIATALRVDWKSCLDVERSLGKLPLRWALQRHVSSPTIPKRGFTVPMGAWLRGPLRPLFRERLFDRQTLTELPISQRALRAWVAEHEAGTADYGWGLWLLLSLALWEDAYWPGQR